MAITAHCMVCREPISEKRRNRNARTCSQDCQTKYRAEYLRRYKTGTTAVPLATLSTGTIGAIAELKAAADLMAAGYEVFRALSPSCSCDLIAMKNGKTLRIEVRTAYQSVEGSLAYSYQDRDVGRADHVAAYLGNGTVQYVPSLPVDENSIPQQAREVL